MGNQTGISDMADALIRLIKAFKKSNSTKLITAGLVTISGYWWEPYLQAGLKKYVDLDIPGLNPLIVVVLGVFLVLLGVYVHFRDKATEQNTESKYSVNGPTGIVGESTKIKGGIHIHHGDTIYQTPRSPLKDQPNLSEEIQDYCEKIETLHNEITLAGFKTRLRIPILIEDIYVPLRALLDLRTTGHTCFGDSQHAEEHLQACDKGKEISLLEAFHEIRTIHRKGIVILGDPGSGKTTHLKRLLLWCLRGGLSRLGLPDDMIPVFLPLRELKDLSAGLSDFIQSRLNQRHLKTPDGFGERMLTRGNLLFLLDGLDEVADPLHRIEVSRWIEEALTAYPDCRFVVTCRFAGYTDKVQLNAHFLEMHIRPLNEKEAQTFIHNWYRIVETSLSADKARAAILAEEAAENLIDRLQQPEFRARRVFELTRNPLLLTNLCLVHRDRGGSLPRGRSKLYEECTDVLLELWRDAIGYQTRIDAQGGRRILQPAALWLHRKEGRTRASADELAPVIDPILKAASWKHGTAHDFLKTVCEESGLLTGWGQDNYGFMHLSFQEYLAAREIRIRAYQDKNVLSELAAHFGESWWQEVMLILLALEEPSHFEVFMAEVVKQPAFTTNINLVDMCLDDAAEISIRPLIDLVKQSPGSDRELHRRQLAALKLIQRRDGSQLEPLLPYLADHPDDEIRKWLQQQSHHKRQAVIHAGRGGYELVRIPAGSFMMGSEEYDDEKPVHEVHISEFYLGRYPVTNEEYEQFMAADPEVKEPAYWGNRRFIQPGQPVVGVSWDDAVKYAEWAGLQLPKEAQWEYACRSGTTTRYYTGDTKEDLARAGWYIGNSDNKLHPVGEKEPNPWGLYDMHGNVWEWCHDWYDGNYYADSPSVDPAGPDTGANRVFRGGSWGGVAAVCRSAYRSWGRPDFRSDSLGFRLASLPGQQPVK